MLHAPNSRDYLTVVFATWRVGAVITPTNCKLTPTEVAALAEVVRPSLLVLDEGADAHAEALAPVPTWTISDGPGTDARAARRRS